jgi:hypothetical protein
MGNNISTGSPKIDIVLLGIGWGGFAFNPQWITFILSAIASIYVIYNQHQIAKKNKNKK